LALSAAGVDLVCEHYDLILTFAARLPQLCEPGAQIGELLIARWFGDLRSVALTIANRPLAT